MKTAQLTVRYTSSVPTEPGLYLNKNGGVVKVVEVDRSDLEKHASDGAWLNGLGAWGPKLVEESVVTSCEPPPPSEH